MNQTKSRGFTLIEVIVALGIIGIVAFSFISVMSTNFRFMQMNKQMTADAFTMQQEMEIAIEAKKANLTNLVTLNNVFENGVTVKVEQLTYVKGTKKIYTLISDVRVPALPVPVLTSVSATLRTSGIPVTQAYAVDTTDVFGSFVLDASTASHFMVNTYYWYVSRDGFNMPSITNPIEMEMSTKYPKFPDDYQIITSSTAQTLPSVADYAGKHIVFTATPASKAGKLGKMIISKPVYISGLPVVNPDLLLHLDGSIINPEDATQTQLNGTSKLITKWFDQSQYKKNAVQLTGSAMPTLIEEPIGGEFVGRYADFVASKNLTVTHSGVNGQNITAFAVVAGNVANKIFVNGTTTVLAAGDPIGNSWRLVKTNYTATSNTIILGNSAVSIAEVLLYKGSLSTEDETKITNYIKEKYVPIESIGVIKSLYDQVITVKQNTTYVPPLAVLAKMEYGPDKYVPVYWTGTINTGSAGSFILTGHAVADNTKTCTLIVTVTAPIAVTGVVVTPSTLSLAVGATNTLLATVSPDNAENKAITWLSSNSSIATVDSVGVVTGLAAGTTTITVKTVDGNFTATTAVTVSNVNGLPSGLVLQLDSDASLDIQNGKVVTWLDRSGQNNHFTQGNNSKQPTYTSSGLAGKAVVSFNGSASQFMTSAKQDLSGVNFFANGTNNFTTFVLAKTTQNSGDQTFIGKAGGWGGSATYAMGMDSSGNFQQVIRGTKAGNSTPGSSLFTLHETRLTGSLHEYFVNCIKRSGHSSIGNAGLQSNDVVIGATNSGNSSFLTGSIAEVLVFNRALTDSERISVEKYLMTKWLVKQGYEFDSSVQSWNMGSAMQSLAFLSEGALQVSFTNSLLHSEKYIESPDYLNWNVDAIKKVHFRMASTASNTSASFDYKKNGNWYSKSFTVINNGQYQDYYLDMTGATAWSGSISAIGITPSINANSGTVKLDFIRLLEN